MKRVQISSMNIEEYIHDGIIPTGNVNYLIYSQEGKRWLLSDYPAELQTKARKFLQDKIGCTITGGNGTYKTSFARAIIIEFLSTTPWYSEWLNTREPEPYESGWRVCQPTAAWVDWFDLCHEASRQAAFDDDADDLIFWYRRADLLIIDDIGEQRTQTRFDTVEDIIKRRFDQGKKTIITTNMKHEAMELSLGRRVTDRMLEYVIVMDGESNRNKEVD